MALRHRGGVGTYRKAEVGNEFAVSLVQPYCADRNEMIDWYFENLGE